MLDDKVGVVHTRPGRPGEPPLPDPKDLRRYDPEDLSRLRSDLRRSVRERIQRNIFETYEPGHGQRQAREQRLIRAIDKYLKNFKPQGVFGDAVKRRFQS